jgi:hypothetical protein
VTCRHSVEATATGNGGAETTEKHVLSNIWE